eukprot:747095-Hanusia_phi.AAC.4
MVDPLPSHHMSSSWYAQKLERPKQRRVTKTDKRQGRATRTRQRQRQTCDGQAGRLRHQEGEIEVGREGGRKGGREGKGTDK